jgi:hypothetical protein
MRLKEAVTAWSPGMIFARRLKTTALMGGSCCQRERQSERAPVRDRVKWAVGLFFVLGQGVP